MACAPFGFKITDILFFTLKVPAIVIDGYVTKKSTHDALSLNYDQFNYFVFNNFCKAEAFSV